MPYYRSPFLQTHARPRYFQSPKCPRRTRPQTASHESTTSTLALLLPVNRAELGSGCRVPLLSLVPSFMTNVSNRIKCNRELPCQNCIVRDIPSRCIYRGHEPVAARARSARAEGMQERLDRLESLVTTLVTQDQGSSQAKPSSEDGRNGQLSRDNNSREANGASVAGIQHGLGVLKVDIKSSVYRGATHWRDVMEEVTPLSLSSRMSCY